MATEPSGGRKDFQDPQTFDQCWIDSTTTSKMADLSTDDNDTFEAFVIAACAAVNKYCRRYFNQQQADDIFLDIPLNTSRYESFTLRNRPVKSIDALYLQVTNVFNTVSTEYIQIDYNSGILKVLPDFNSLVLARLPEIDTVSSSNFWVRYTSGFEIVKAGGGFTTNDVPKSVQIATAMYVSYLFDIQERVSGLQSFKTQTYSESNSDGNFDDPKLSAFKSLLNPYRKMHTFGTL